MATGSLLEVQRHCNILGDQAQEMAYWGANQYPDLKSVASGPAEDIDQTSRAFRKCISFDSKDENGWTALHWAAAINNAEVAKALIDCGGVVFLETRTLKKVQFGDMFIWASLTPLHIAAVAGSIEVAKVLIDAGADVNALDRMSGTPLNAAMFWGHLGLAQLLLASGARAKPLDSERGSSSAPTTPIRNEEFEPFMPFGDSYSHDYQAGSWLTAGNHLVHTSLGMGSVFAGYPKDDLHYEGQKTPNGVLDMDALVSCQADGHQSVPPLRHKRSISLLPRSSFTDWVPPPQPDSRSEPPSSARRFPGIRGPESHNEPPPPIPCVPEELAVFTAARDNNCEILSEYLGNGCNAMLVDNNGWTLLHWAAAGNAVEAAQVLLQNGAPVDMQTTAEVDFNGRVWVGSSPLHVAANLGYLEVAQVLLRANANTEVCDCTGGTPMHSAAYWGAADVARVLLENGANPMSHTKGLSTPLHHACRSGHEVMAEILVRAGAAVNAQNSTKQTPLHLAALAGHVNLVEILVQSGADKTVKNKKAKTPLQCICRGMDIAPSAMLDLAGTKAKLRSLLS